MTYRIHITKAAERDMERAVDYIEYTLKNPQAADALLDEADTAINSLAHMPERYAPVDDQMLAALGIRFIQVKNYLAFYVIAKDTRTVQLSLTKRCRQNPALRCGIFASDLLFYQKSKNNF